MEAAVRRGGGSVLVRAGVAVGVLLMAGCSSNPVPAPLADPPTHSTSRSPTPVSDPSPSHAGPPTMPAAAKGTSAKAAKAFVRYYIATINYAAATGDLAVLGSLGTPGCVSCEAIAHNITRIYEAGGTIRSGGWKLVRVRILQIHGNTAGLSLDVVLRPEVVVKHAGAPAEKHVGARQPMTAFLRRSGRVWRVSRLDLVT